MFRGKPARFDRFVDGVNTQSAPYDLGDREARDVRNVVATARGAIRKRDGSVQFAAPAATLKGLFAGGSPDVLIGTSASAIYGITSGGAVTSLKTALANAPWDWVQAPAVGGQGAFYGVNGTDTPQQWDGSAGSTSDWTASTGTVPAAAKFLAYAGNRVWAASDTHVYWSNLGDPRNWPVSNVLQLDPTDGEDITGIGTAGPYVLVFKTSKVWRIHDLDGGANQRIGVGVGAASNRSITETPSGTFFLSDDQGVMVTSGSDIKQVSQKIAPTLDLISSSNAVRAAGAFIGGHYYLAVPTSGVVNDLLLDYDLEQGAWWIHTLPCSQLAVARFGGAEPVLRATRSDVARVDTLFVDGETQDAGANYESYWRGPFHAFKTPYQQKRCRAIHFDGMGRIQVSVTKDFQRAAQRIADEDFSSDEGDWGVDDGGLWGVGTDGEWGGLSEVGEAHVATPGVGRAWSVTFGNDTDDSFEVESYTMFMEGGL